MDSNLISALSALGGAVLGGSLSLLASWLVNERQVRVQWLGHDREHREDLYKEFIEQAAKCYVHALLHDKPAVPSLVVLYAKMSRMRVLSSPQVIENGERLIKEIIQTYSRPNKSLTEVQAMNDDSFDVIRGFAEACRAEFNSLRAQTL
jgi:hypothetical protein